LAEIQVSGKSTLLLQAAGKTAHSDFKTAYISGEESVDQVRRRAKRLGFENASVSLASETSLGPILDGLMIEKPDIIIIDSIQTLWTDQISAAPGTVTQVRACAQELTRFAKKSGACVILVGHVTKDGQIAGPRVVEHMVDAVLYFEGDRAHQFRILRAHKNRFGPTDEIGVFEMRENGLSEVANPSALFLDGRGAASTWDLYLCWLRRYKTCSYGNTSSSCSSSFWYGTASSCWVGQWTLSNGISRT
jgi:DNA repair protein RadA/Sms